MPSPLRAQRLGCITIPAARPPKPLRARSKGPAARQFWLTGKAQNLSDVTLRTAFFLILSGLATGASWLCYFRALQIGDASRVAPLDKLSVVFVAVIAAVFLGERLSGLNWGGVPLIAAGSILVAVG